LKVESLKVDFSLFIMTIGIISIEH